MRRALTIIIATLVLLLIGYLLGRRPVAGLSDEVDTLRQTHQEQVTGLQERAALAEAHGYLWQARAELLLASLDLERSNFGTAAEHAESSRVLLTRAAGVPGMSLDLTGVQNQVDGALKGIRDLDPAARSLLVQASTALGRILEQRNA